MKAFFIYHDRMAVMRRSGPGRGPGRRTPSESRNAAGRARPWRKKTPEPSSLRNPTFFKSAYSEDFHRVLRYGEVVNEVESIPFEFDSLVSSDHQVKMFRDAAYVLSMRF